MSRSATLTLTLSLKGRGKPPITDPSHLKLLLVQLNALLIGYLLPPLPERTDTR